MNEELEGWRGMRQPEAVSTLEMYGGDALVDYLVERGLQARHAAAAACFVDAVSLAVAEPEQYGAAFMMVNEGLRYLELVNDGSQASQIKHLPLLGIVDERVIGLVSGFTMEEFEILTDGVKKRQRSWKIRQAAVQGLDMHSQRGFTGFKNGVWKWIANQFFKFRQVIGQSFKWKRA
ncbi:hypothetical protein [Methylomonas sp. CM2]|uniref:hypothetical protein n=1 Tax=Methylomonas sp. CM2 TaxID=3417647 RepID=UPI003CE945E3